MDNDYRFDSPLIEGLIRKRPNRFIMEVEINGDIYNCHCPTTGRIGNLVMEDIPCLLSTSTLRTRKTPYTVEAFSLDLPDELEKSWIGINQNAVNRYVEHYLANGGFLDMVGTSNNVKREQFIGISKLDFLVSNTYLEVKTPLQQLQVDIPSHIRTKRATPFSATDRMVRHVTELADSLQDHQRAIFLSCFIYDNPGFRVIERSTNYEQVKSTMELCTAAGVEMWQANFRITPESVSLIKYFQTSEISDI
ncbi:Sugar fermentation stimulation protein A [compost metagenome]